MNTFFGSSEKPQKFERIDQYGNKRTFSVKGREILEITPKVPGGEMYYGREPRIFDMQASSHSKESYQGVLGSMLREGVVSYLTPLDDLKLTFKFYEKGTYVIEKYKEHLIHVNASSAPAFEKLKDGMQLKDPEIIRTNDLPTWLGKRVNFMKWPMSDVSILEHLSQKPTCDKFHLFGDGVKMKGVFTLITVCFFCETEPDKYSLCLCHFTGRATELMKRFSLFRDLVWFRVSKSKKEIIDSAVVSMGVLRGKTHMEIGGVTKWIDIIKDFKQVLVAPEEKLFDTFHSGYYSEYGHMMGINKETMSNML